MSFLSRSFTFVQTPFSLQVRTATKRAGGTVHNHGGSPGKRLGLKKFSDQSVIPGNIIVRQRGTLFHPGQHVKMGRDHTIYATAPGYVRFYKEKWMRGFRRYVGVVLERGDTLPRDEQSFGRSRYFGLISHWQRLILVYIVMSHLTITPLKYPDIPPEQTIIDEGWSLIDSVSTWKQGKTFHNKVRTYRRPKQPGEATPWCCRISQHTTDEATFDQLWDKLGRNKAVNEQQFIPEIQKVTQVKSLSETAEIWTLYYKFTPPVSPRVFTVLQVVRLNEQLPRSGIIVSIPVDISGDKDLAQLEEKGVRGCYVSVETLTELENGDVVWKMATASNSGGLIPSFIADSVVPSAIAKDVPHFFEWLHKTNK